MQAIYKTKQGLYNTTINNEEFKALEEWCWPTEVSEKLLQKDLSGKILLDVGAGPNRKLGDIVKSRGGKYIATDINNAFVDAQRKLGRITYKVDISKLSSILNPSIDRKSLITHTRLVLLHIARTKQKKAIKELGKVGTSGYILDTDWKNFIKKAPNKHIQEFIALVHDFANWKSIDLFHGSKLKKLITNTLGHSYMVKEQIFSQGMGNHYDEIIELAKRARGAYIQDNNKKIAEKFNYLITVFKKLQKQNNKSDYFEPPCFYTVSFKQLNP